MKKFQDIHITLLDMRLQLVILAIVLLLDWCSAYAIPNQTDIVRSNSTENDNPTDNKPVVNSLSLNNLKFSPLALRPHLNSYINLMKPRINAFSPRSLKRLSAVPLRGFFAFRSPQTLADPTHEDGLLNSTVWNCSENSSNCLEAYPLRQMSKRVAMASGMPRTRRPYDVPQIGESFRIWSQFRVILILLMSFNSTVWLSNYILSSCSQIRLHGKTPLFILNWK